MKDSYGRSIDYLRISLTDKCNLRCLYCMPAEGIKHLEHADILSMEEIGRLVQIMSGLGVSKVRLTGGEPLVRKGVTGLIRILRDDCHMHRIAMTSNGMLLSGSVSEDGNMMYSAAALKEAGLTDINISLDTLDPETFVHLTGINGLEKTKQGIETAIASGLNVRLNCVPIKGVNEMEIPDLVRFASGLGAELRFIELMPIGCGVSYEGIPSDEIIGMLEEVFGASPETSAVTEKTVDVPGRMTDGPAKYLYFEKCDTRIGFISPMTHKFCDRCNRVRLTAAGFLKLCLQYPDGVDLRTPLRTGATDDEIADIIMEAVSRKPAAHSFDNRPKEADRRKMVEIGG